ncbi:ABUW_2363 family tetratricopeptide repeat lipoprotein [Moraxella sp. ZY210820]|uniref:ABUW_2363 family tetratricopeptide repeat lipoprotein n=1 Tax=unclassified Moraxella TaxID=2685852 RepID=UPI002730D2FE|nr:hypothetical protein [Moraxella sp. ZY210820]WLF85097.1 hypothetical protein LU301_07210 [Moraxella sp. ZY210820]
MNLKTLSIIGLTVGLTACLTTPEKTKTNTPVVQAPQATVFEEPVISAPFYALNPFQYDQPPVFELALQQAKNSPVQAYQITQADGSVVLYDKNKLIIPLTQQTQRATRFAVLPDEGELDVTEIDDFINLLEGKARHYPAQFHSKNERYGYSQKLKKIITELDQYAVLPDASFDILLRAFKANVMARNLDLGQIYTTKSLSYAQRLAKMNANDGEFNLWFGFSLAEGGAQREALPYLDKAMKANVQEAYLATVNAYLGMEHKKNAINTLKQYKLKYPTEANVADRLIQEIEAGQRWNVWQVNKK